MRRLAKDFARAVDPWRRRVENMIRRVPRIRAAGALWEIFGHEDESGQIETATAEDFSGIGIVARPPDGANAEAIVVNIGASIAHPVVIATRDLGTNRDVIEVARLNTDETIVFNSGAMLKLTADGEVHIGRPGGAFKRVATEDHTHGPGTFTAPNGAVTGKSGPPDAVSSVVKVQ
jgi:phage gp45-like